jgi:hypothetical protein
LKNYLKEKKKNDAIKKKLEKQQAAVNLTKSILREAKDDLDAKAFEDFNDAFVGTDDDENNGDDTNNNQKPTSIFNNKKILM